MFGAFIARTMLIYILGVKYVGLDGLFTSVLSILNMAEMGFSSAVVFKLYKPIAEGNDEEVCALLNYYKRIYRYIGIAIAIVGLALAPFLSYIIKSDLPSDVNLYVLYAIYLINAVLSYWLFAYKTALLNAHQRNDLVSKISCISFLVKYVLQFIFLAITKSYYAFAIIVPVTTLLTNLGNAYIANKKYQKFQCRGEISKEDKKEVKNKVTALLYNKIGIAIINGSDNIVISSFLGLNWLGIYSSYYYVFTLLHNVFDVFHSGITAGVGNSIVTDSVEKNYKLFNRLLFVNNWLVGWCSICMACLYEPFITLWVGKENTLPVAFSVIMAVYFYIWMIRFIVLTFKNAQGLWREDRYRALIEGLLNLGLNLFMVQRIGIYGIVISTIIAMVVVSVPWETRVLFNKYFKCSVKQYYLKVSASNGFDSPCGYSHVWSMCLGSYQQCN